MTDVTVIRASPGFGLPIQGVALDAVKLFAALFMVCDHINSVLWVGAVPNMYIAGRIAFPLFCYAAACNLARGGTSGRYAGQILIFAILAQPIFAIAAKTQLANVLFTLSAGAAVGAWLINAHPVVRHAVFGLVAVACFTLPVSAYTGVEFGLAGVALPAAIALVLRGDLTVTPWLLLMLFLINMSPPQPDNPDWWWWFWATGLAAALGGIATIAAVSWLPRRGRFLPRYFLHVFYPGHLAILALIRDWKFGGPVFWTFLA